MISGNPATKAGNVWRIAQSAIWRWTIICPRCSSTELLIRHPSGFERVLILLTHTRQFMCRRCYLVFRALDRVESPPMVSMSGDYPELG